MVEATARRVDPLPNARHVRSFARDHLDDGDEDNAATERFLRWALHLAAWIDHTTDTDDEPLADRVLRRELANLRAAWRLTRIDHRLDNAVRLVTA